MSNSMLKAYIGQPRYSLANWLALHNPLIVVDEAHNTRTDKSFVALKRLNPSAILELTATPLPHQSNVLYHVSAQELQAENMIKLPITLREHRGGLGGGGVRRGADATMAGDRGAAGAGGGRCLCAADRFVPGAERE